MSDSQNLFSGKRKYLFLLALLSFILVIFATFSMADKDDFNIARREVLLRKIGHELLLQSGDSVSRVLPVKKIAENEYQISFEKEFSFQPDSLANTTRRLLANDPLTSDYVVNVINCGNSDVAYGYAISKNRKEDNIPCIGRIQPKACYIINIKFKQKVIDKAKNGYLFAGLPFLALVGFLFFKSGTTRKRKTLPDSKNTDTFTLGSVLFDAKNRKLTTTEKTIDLTGTETRLLLIFALSPNETIERSRLQKEIWEDEGVIVGRSLDMFISKLRKKLELDSNINIVVIRGKGYKLEIRS
ncbi:transcriptional regulator [Flavobacterium sp. Leaf359]|uniref:winged helix-turn-helix domain-containing protein n=1 Tax=Flavobacterium sp. Leaf359 TaxID=1736351 RepID=UPI0006F2B49A|nr:winged helix-turn-helix domain-containing protein [Flavobacterium sp. Leaf359]KQS53606.1 transcriptional regulator [Flavobacterium sp. Leaf359]